MRRSSVPWRRSRSAVGMAALDEDGLPLNGSGRPEYRQLERGKRCPGMGERRGERQMAGANGPGARVRDCRTTEMPKSEIAERREPRNCQKAESAPREMRERRRRFAGDHRREAAFALPAVLRSSGVPLFTPLGTFAVWHSRRLTFPLFGISAIRNRRSPSAPCLNFRTSLSTSRPSATG